MGMIRSCSFDAEVAHGRIPFSRPKDHHQSAR